MDERLKHLSEKEIIELSQRYYDGENVKTLIEEYKINISPVSLFAILPAMEVPDKICEYCGTNLVIDAVSRSRGNHYSQSNMYCPKCGHKPFAKNCNCGNCIEKRKEEEKRKRNLIAECYAKTGNELDFNDLCFKNKVYLGALCSLTLSEDMFNIMPYVKMERDLRLAPTDEMLSRIYKGLIDEKAISVSELSDLEAFPDDDENEFPNTYYIFKVMYKLNLNNSGGKNELHKAIMNPKYYNLSMAEDAYALWVEIAKEECVEFLIYELQRTGFDFNPGKKTYSTFETLLEDFSVAQIYGIINKSVANASKYYLQENISKNQAANSVVGGCQRYADQAICNNWELVCYNRRKELPQSEVAAFFFNRVLKIGDSGFNEKPHIIKGN